MESWPKVCDFRFRDLDAAGCAQQDASSRSTTLCGYMPCDGQLEMRQLWQAEEDAVTSLHLNDAIVWIWRDARQCWCWLMPQSIPASQSVFAQRARTCADWMQMDNEIAEAVFAYKYIYSYRVLFYVQVYIAHKPLNKWSAEHNLLW